MNIYSGGPEEIQMESFVRSKPQPVPPPRFQWAQRMSVVPNQYLQRVSHYISTHNPLPKRDLNKELGNVNYDPSNRSSCSLLVVVLVIR